MYEYKISISCVLICLLYLPTGNSLKCGVCRSEFNINCLDASLVTTTETCPSNKPYVCRTIEYYSKEDRRNHIARGCVEEKDGSNNDACSKTRLVWYTKVNSCQTCNGDLCNINRRISSSNTAGQSESRNVKQNFAAPQQEKDFGIPDMTNYNQKSLSVSIQSSFSIVIACLSSNILYKMYHYYL